MNERSPVTIFAYCRPEHLRRTIGALRRNPEACETDLIIFSDGARNQQDAAGVEAVRELLRGVTGFRSVEIRESTRNLGLARSIIRGVTDVIERYGRVIVLEDDLETSSSFLRYMNEALDRFVSDDRVASIHGYMYPIREALPPAFFLRGADCLGWGTWSRAWRLFEPDGAKLLAQLQQRKLTRAFDFHGSYPFTRMLRNQVAGKNDSWAVRWYASVFLAGKLTLYPGKSLVRHIGTDPAATNCAGADYLDVDELGEAPMLHGVPVQHNEEAARAIARFLRRVRWRRWVRHILRKTGTQ